jgi:hypothetical protein
MCICSHIVSANKALAGLSTRFSSHIKRSDDFVNGVCNLSWNFSNECTITFMHAIAYHVFDLGGRTAQ